MSMNVAQPTLKKDKHGKTLDVYDVLVTIDGVVVDAGSLYIVRSLVENRRILIELGPGEKKIGETWEPQSEIVPDENADGKEES